MIRQSLPELAVDERHHSTGIFWCAAVVLTGRLLVFSLFVSCLWIENAPRLVAATSFSISLAHDLMCFIILRRSYLPEATDVTLDVSWNTEV